MLDKNNTMDILTNRINELNELIGQLNEENYKLKNRLKYSKCIYPIFLVQSTLNDIKDMNFSESDILDIVKDASIIGDDFVNDMLIDEEGHTLKFFSMLGMAKMLNFLNGVEDKIDESLELSKDKLPSNYKTSIKNIKENELC